MNLTVTGHHVVVTPAIRSYVEAKLERAIRHCDHATAVSVILSIEKLRQKAEANVHVRGQDIYVEHADADLYAAIDVLADKLDRKLIKYKDRAYAKPHAALKHQAEE
jgi:putative sigma-54 modulation protein